MLGEQLWFNSAVHGATFVTMMSAQLALFLRLAVVHIKAPG